MICRSLIESDGRSEGRAGDFVSETEHVNSIATRLRQHNTDALQHADTVSGCPVSPVGGMEDRSRFLRESKPSIPRPPVRRDKRRSSNAPRLECGDQAVRLLMVLKRFRDKRISEHKKQ